MNKLFILFMIAITGVSIWATYTGYGLPTSEIDSVDLRQQSADQRPYGHQRRFASGGYRHGK